MSIITPPLSKTIETLPIAPNKLSSSSLSTFSSSCPPKCPTKTNPMHISRPSITLKLIKCHHCLYSWVSFKLQPFTKESGKNCPTLMEPLRPKKAFTIFKLQENLKFSSTSSPKTNWPWIFSSKMGNILMTVTCSLPWTSKNKPTRQIFQS